MIGGGCAFVIAAYSITLAGLLVLAISVAVRARTWAKRARELDAKRSARR